MRFQKSDTNVIYSYFSYEFKVPYKKLCVHKKDPYRPPLMNLEQLYKKELPISHRKITFSNCARVVLSLKRTIDFFSYWKPTKTKWLTRLQSLQLRNTLLTCNTQSARKLKEVKFLHLSVLSDLKRCDVVSIKPLLPLSLNTMFFIIKQLLCCCIYNVVFSSIILYYSTWIFWPLTCYNGHINHVHFIKSAM